MILAFLHRRLGWILRGGDDEAALFVDGVFSDFADSVGSIQKSLRRAREPHFIKSKIIFHAHYLVARGSVYPADAS